MASGGPQKLQSLKVSSTTPEKIDVDAIVDRILKLTHKLDSDICLTSLTRAKCGTRSTLCWKILNISDSTELFAL